MKNMRLSCDHTWVRLAALPDSVIEKFLKEYRVFNSGNNAPLTVDDVQRIEAGMEKTIPGKGGLATQWMLQSISRGSGSYPWDWNNGSFLRLATWYFAHQKEPLFREVVQEYFGLNPKNLLDFTYSEMRRTQFEYGKAEEIAQVNKFPRSLPTGSRLFYDDGNHKILEVIGQNAACELAKGTEWCTSDEGHAEYYLEGGPLYVIYRGEDKVGQLFLGDGNDPSVVEIKNLKNKNWMPDPETRQVLIKSGLMASALEILSQKPAEARNTILRFLGREDDPTLRKYCSGDPWLAYYYAMDVIHKRFFAGEDEIIRNEPDLLPMYITMMRANDPKGYREFMEDHPEFAEHGGEPVES